MNIVDLEAWKKFRAFRKAIFQISKTWLLDEKYRLTDQILRSSRSISANIAEEHGRYQHKQNIRFCRMARGSLMESQDHLICAFDCRYIDEPTYQDLMLQIQSIYRLVNGDISYLKKQS